MFPGNIRTIRMNEQSIFLIYIYVFRIAEYITSMISKWENHSSKAVTESKSNGMQTLV